jgi:hypothetical protein
VWLGRVGKSRVRGRHREEGLVGRGYVCWFTFCPQCMLVRHIVSAPPDLDQGPWVQVVPASRMFDQWCRCP